MYGRNPCGNGLGAHALAEPTLNDANEASWWERPATQVAGAIAQRIGGSTSPYSPGTYGYGDPGYTSYPTQYPMSTRAPTTGFATGAGVVVLGVVALGAAKLFGFF